MDIKNAQKIHCIGIGGIGVSALAALWRAQGKQVSGSDAVDSEITKALEDQGISVLIGAQGQSFVGEGLSLSDIVIYSDAVPEDHPERSAARSRGIPEMSYAQALGQVSRQYRTIVVTGTHGKSTTTAMLGLIAQAAGLDPLVLVGSRVPQWGNSNLRLRKKPSPQSSPTGGEEVRENSPPLVGGVRGGGVPWFIVEGDDYRDHFLELEPYAVVVTSIEWDHPDYFRDLEHTVESFKSLCEKVPENGFVVLNEDDGGCQQLNQRLSCSPIRANWRTTVYGKGSEMFAQLHLQVPGEFNRYNATAAATTARELGVAEDVAQKALGEFRGIWRRFEILGNVLPPPLTPPRTGGETKTVSSPLGGEVRRGPIMIISDYAHHPTAIRETMKTARGAYPDRRLVLVYQPHQHSRTKYFFKDFVEVLKDAADVVILSEIYAVKGRMEDQDINSHELVEAIKRLSDEAIKSNNLITQSLNNTVLYGGDLAQTKQVVLEQIKPGDVLVFMGAGDIDDLARSMTDKLKSRLPEVKENVPMAEYTTFKIGGPARYFFVARSSDDVARAVRAAREVGIAFFIMGGASNILISDKGFDGLVILSRILGCIFEQSGDQVIATVGAGEIWDEFVARAVDKNLAGVECLSGIPGTVGAAPVQNVGAYGQSVDAVIKEVRVFDSQTFTEVVFDRASCAFGYRDSIFKKESGRFIITQVVFALTPGLAPTIIYRDLIEYFNNARIEGRSAALHVPLSGRQAPALQSGDGEGEYAPSLAQVRKAIIEIRARKGYVIMSEYESFATAGSFFKNPVISQAQFQDVRAKIHGCAESWYWELENGSVKISAACLLQTAGFQKGYRQGNAGISPKHSLSLMNYGGASAQEIVALAQKIQTRVREQFAIELIPEVQLVM